MRIANRARDVVEADPSRFVIFRYDEAPECAETDVTRPPTGSDHTMERYRELWEAGSADGIMAKVLYRQSGERPMSVVHSYVKPGRIVPRHSHDTDCLYCVSSGSITLGRQVLRPGDGLFVPANHSYAYRAGDDGAEVLEFRMARSFGQVVRDETDGTWDQYVAIAAERRDEWREDRVLPSRRRGGGAL
jgi:quercetin dioxygenase-like cupin family protein